jgi:hypothetical protein
MEREANKKMIEASKASGKNQAKPVKKIKK